MENNKLIPDNLAAYFPFLYQNIEIKTENRSPFENMESNIPAIQNPKARLSNFYKCISRF